MKVIRLPTAAREPVRNPAVYDTAPRRMCEARGYLDAVRVALRVRPDIPRSVILATANDTALTSHVSAFDIIASAARGVTGCVA